MPAIPAPLLKKLRQTLLDCGPFGSQRTLEAVFTDDRIASWRNQIPDAGNRRERVDLFVSAFQHPLNRLG